jgi:DNA-binding beta-propeller fold protein YncE
MRLAMGESRTITRGANWMLLVAAFALLGLVMPGVARRAAGAQSTPQRRALPVWPLPPETPRVRYLTSYRGSTDFKVSKPGRWKTALFGSAPDTERSDTFVKPYAVAVSPQGRVYVSDTAARRVFAIDPDKSTLTFVGEGGNTALAKPVGVAVDAAGIIYVADATLKRILAFTPSGSLALAIGREGEFDSPAGIAIDRVRKLVYVVDSSRHQILAYSTTDGRLVRTIGRRGGEAGEFNFPTNVFVDRQGRLFVADTLNFRVQIFGADGQFLRAFGELGDTAGTMNRPKGIGVDSEGHIYVADTAFDNFQIFDEQGRLLLYVGRGGADPGQFMLPAGLYVDERDRIFVADQGNARVQVFQYIRERAR